MSYSSEITVIVPTCPRPSHPSTRILDETIESVRRELPDSHIIITCDGGKLEMDRKEITQYAGFCETIQGRYDNSQVIKFTERGHQTGNMAAVLPLVMTPLIFYCEDDWRILPNIQWVELSKLVLDKEYNYIKLYPAPRVIVWHEQHFFQRVHHEIGQEHVFMIQTNQFSANPHLASTAWYRAMSEKFNFAGRIDFIEEALHGIIGQAPWEEYKLSVYNPHYGDMYRCLHLDGKGNQQ